MSYQPVTKERLALFLAQLGRAFRKPARLYLVGGTELLYDGLKASTKDVDLAVDLAPEDDAAFTRALIDLRNALQMAVEITSPADFIPVPAGTALRHRYLSRIGTIDIYAYDPLATALAKLARSRAGDIEDVLALLRVGTIQLEDLEAGFAEILPRVATEALKVTDADYKRKFDAFITLAKATLAPDAARPQLVDQLGSTEGDPG